LRTLVQENVVCKEMYDNGGMRRIWIWMWMWMWICSWMWSWIWIWRWGWRWSWGWRIPDPAMRCGERSAINCYLMGVWSRCSPDGRNFVRFTFSPLARPFILRSRTGKIRKVLAFIYLALDKSTIYFIFELKIPYFSYTLQSNVDFLQVIVLSFLYDCTGT